jgi:hypothetical protein
MFRPCNVTANYQMIDVFHWKTYQKPSVGETVFAYNRGGKYIGRWTIQSIDRIVDTRAGLEYESFNVHVLPLDTEAVGAASEALLAFNNAEEAARKAGSK